MDLTENPLVWWKLHQTAYPLLARYYKSNGAFQATSVASERIYNVDKLVNVKIKKYNLRSNNTKPSRSMMTGGRQSKCRGEVAW